jgi:hypothetical protein
VVGVVAEAKHRGRERVEVDVSLLSGIIGEVEELRDALTGLKSKYTGVKVGAIYSGGKVLRVLLGSGAVRDCGS